jgi:prepilin-type N-terminal cleavage/methylation domain-containing protein
MSRNVQPRGGPRGFTLIELLVVIAIIGLLSSIVLASLNTARSKARDAVRSSDAETIRTALELYANGHGGQYPDETAGGSGCWWVWQSGNVNGGSAQWLDKLVQDGDLSQAPKEQTIGGCTYRYAHFSEAPTGCGSPSGTYAALYWVDDNPRAANSPYAQSTCMAGWGWGEAGPGDPNGYLMLLPQ